MCDTNNRGASVAHTTRQRQHPASTEEENMSTWTCYLCKSAGPGGSAAYQRHYLTHHAEALHAEWVAR